MAKVFNAYFCNKSIDNDFNHNYVISGGNHILKSNKIPHYQIYFNKDNFIVEYKEKMIYNSYNEDLIYWTNLEDLKIKLDKIMIFQ